MPGQARWATEEQTKFLVSHFSEYVDIYSTSKSYAPFWAKIKVDWLKLFPVDAGSMFPLKSDNELTPEDEAAIGMAIKKLMKQIKDWFRWRVNPAAIVGGRRGRQKAAIEIPGRMRQLKPEEMYSKLFYKSKIKPRVDRADTKNMAKGDKLNLVKKLTREMYEAEEDSVKLEVMEKLEERAKSMEDAALDDQATPEQYHRAIQELPHTVSHFINGLERRTGWAFTILMGGPDPHLGGEISVGSCHTGLTPDGLNFAESFPNFDAHYQVPFTKFLSEIYPESVRRSRALFSVEDHSDSEDNNCGSDGKDAFRGLINANGDRISPIASTSAKTVAAPKTVAALTTVAAPTVAAMKMAPKLKNPISTDENQHPANNLVQDLSGWNFSDPISEGAPLAAQSISNFCPTTDISSLDINFGPFSFSDSLDNSGSIQGSLTNLLWDDNAFLTFPSYASDLQCDMGLFPGPFLPTTTPTFGPFIGGANPSHLHPTPDLHALPLCDNNNPSPTNGVLLNVTDAHSVQGENEDPEATPPLDVPNTVSDLSGGQICLEASLSSANIDRTSSESSLPIQRTPKITPPLTLSSGFDDLFPGQISSTVRPSTATTPPMPTNYFGNPLGRNLLSEFGSQTVATLPTQSKSLMGHVSPPIVTGSHLPLSLPCGTPSPTLPGTTISAQTVIVQQRSPGASPTGSIFPTPSTSSISPAMPPSQSATAPFAPPADTRRSGRALVPSKRLEAMHEIGSNVPKGLPLTEQFPEKENFDPQAPPEWTSLAKEHLLTRDLGPDWQECVNMWLELESRLGYGTMTGTKNALPAIDLRPEEWNKWVNKSRNGRRKYEAVPTISDSAEFGIALTKWWHGMQPGFRKSEHDMPLPTYMASTPIMWDPLRKAGPNGLVSVLTMAVWWGQSLAARTRWQDDSSEEWKVFIVDVHRTLSEIAKTTTTERKKRGAPAGIEKKSKRTKV